TSSSICGDSAGVGVDSTARGAVVAVPAGPPVATAVTVNPGVDPGVAAGTLVARPGVALPGVAGASVREPVPGPAQAAMHPASPTTSVRRVSLTRYPAPPDSKNDRAANSGSGARRIAAPTHTPSAPAANSGAEFCGVMPPMTTSGSRVAARTLRSKLSPAAGPALALVDVANIGPAGT